MTKIVLNTSAIIFLCASFLIHEYNDSFKIKNRNNNSYALVASVAKKINGEEKWGVIDHNEKTIIPFEYDYIGHFRGCYTIVLKNEHGKLKNAVIDVRNEIIFSFVPNEDIGYSDIIENKWVLYATNIADDMRMGMVDINGRDILTNEFTMLFRGGSSNSIIYMKEREMGILEIDKGTVKKILYGNFTFIEHSHEDIYIVCMREKGRNRCGYMGLDGLWVIKPRYRRAFQFREGRAYVEYVENGIIKRAIIDEKGDKIYIFNKGERCCSLKDCYYSSGLLPICQDDGGIKYVDKQGKTRLEFKEALSGYPFSEGVSLIFFDEGFTYINREGKRLTDTYYDGASSFQNGYAAVLHSGKWGYINNEGRFHIPYTYNNARLFVKVPKRCFSK